MDNVDNLEKEVEENVSNFDKYEFASKLREEGIDPMVYFREDLFSENQYIEYPIIGGYNWKDEGVLNEIRLQMEKR